MIIPLPFPTSTMIPTFLSPVGHGEVIKMNYEIGFGKFEKEKPDTNLVDTESFKDGVSLTSIRWSFNNIATCPADSNKNTTVFEFEIHDIAGKSLANFINLRRANTCLFFKGPMSDGSFWMPGTYARYVPVPEECSLEFSPTQGFTYKIVAHPYYVVVNSHKFMSIPRPLTVNGLDKDGKRHDNTFKAYLKEIEDKWNDQLAQNPNKKATAQIKFVVDEGRGVNSMMMKTTPFFTEHEKEVALNPSGNPQSPVLDFTFQPGSSVSMALMELWQQRFVGHDSGGGKGITGSSTLHIYYGKTEGGVSHIGLDLLRRKDSDQPVDPIPVCIGSDLNCIGARYRASLSNITLNSIIANVLVDKLNQEKNQAVQEPSQPGNTENETTNVSKGEDGDYNRDTSEDIPQSPGMPRGNNRLFDGWAVFSSTLNSAAQPDLSLEIEMPYTYAFTPKLYGGLLEDADKTFHNCLFTDGTSIDLEFYWYTDPTCEVLMKVEPISTKYRLVSATHEIGLNGNTTQLKLNHLVVGSQ